MNTNTWKLIILSGVSLVLVGVVIYLFHDKLHWLGHLPGDIRINRENFRLYIPFTTMILASLVISFVLFLIRKIF